MHDVSLFINDRFSAESESILSSQDRGFLLGDGTFTTMSSNLLLFGEHYHRLASTAAALEIPFLYSLSDVQHICKELMLRNSLVDQQGVIRMTLTRGRGGRGIAFSAQAASPTFLVTAKPMAAHNNKPLRLQISSIRRNSTSLASRYKTLSYIDAIMARRYATAAGFDDALFLNENGCCVCTTAANIFFVHKHTIITPPLDSGIVPGIMRARVMGLCCRQGLACVEKALIPDQLQDIDEIFITNSLIGIQAVAQVDTWHSITNQITQLLQNEITVLHQYHRSHYDKKI